jgi:hypothetical protein
LERANGDGCVIDVRRCLGGRADEGLPEEQPAASTLEPTPIEMGLSAGATVAQLAEDPGNLDEPRRERRSPGAGRPGAVALTGTRRAQMHRVRGHTDEERAFKAKHDGPGAGEVFSDGVNELNDLGATTMSLDPCFVCIAASPPKAGLWHGADVGTVDGELHTEQDRTWNG